MSLKCLHAFINLICIVRTSFEETLFFRDEKISLSRSCYRLEIIVLYHILFKIRLLNLFFTDANSVVFFYMSGDEEHVH